MKAKNKTIRYVLLLVVCTFVVCLSWMLLRPVEIIVVHKNDNFSDVLVTNFPLTDKGKINWWLESKDKLSKNYVIPNPSPNSGRFSVTF